jgi:O-antigen ligase
MHSVIAGMRRFGGLSPGTSKTIVAATMVGAYAALFTVCMILSADMPVAVFVPILCLLGIAASGVAVLAATGSIPALIVVFAVLLFMTDGNFRVHPEMDAGLDWQSVLKFVVWTTSGAIGIPLLRRGRSLIKDPASALWLSYMGAASMSVFLAPSPTISFGYVVALFGLYVFSFALVNRLSEVQILWTITLTLASFLVISWVVAYTVPDLGEIRDLSVDGFKMRMSGIAGQPVNLGSVCAIYLCAVFLLAWKQYTRLTTALLLAGLGLVTLSATDSRTALFGACAGILLVVSSRSGAALAGLGLAMAIGFLLAFTFPISSNFLGSYFSRSGEASEVMTLSGRTQIWDFAWEKIVESPLLGWGYNSSREILAHHVGFADGLVVDNAHNLLLQNLLSVGLVGTLPLAGLLLKLIVDIVRGRCAHLSALFVVLAFVTGVSDPSALGTTPTVLTIIFMLASLWSEAPRNPRINLRATPSPTRRAIVVPVPT